MIADLELLGMEVASDTATMQPKLLLVDDDDQITTQMKWGLADGYTLVTAANRREALRAFKEHKPKVVLLDLGLPPSVSTPEEGLAILNEMLAADSLTKVIIISGQAEKNTALQAIGAGAYDFLTKPINLEELKVILKRTYHVAGLERTLRKQNLPVETDLFEGMLGSSPRMRQVFNAIRKVASAEAPVLILGESGTGKEMVARAIHARSDRKQGPFVAINCGAIPENLLESELFGHEKGSFTGAHVQRKGRIEAAGGGTLFLDEIGELPTLLQVKLLRFLQEQRIERVGGREEIPVDTRVIAATNVDLKKAISESNFREDLYYRLAVVIISLPPLREREEDIRLMAEEFLKRATATHGKGKPVFSLDALRALHQHNWPGNVRELENRVKRAVIMAERKHLSPADLELAPPVLSDDHANLREARQTVERELLQRALRKHSGKIAPAAAELGISRPTFYELMEKLGVTRPERESKVDESSTEVE